MADEIIQRDDNRVTVLAGLTDDILAEIRNLLIDPDTGRLLVSAIVSGGGGGNVDSVNGQTGVVVLDTGDIADTTNKRYVTDAHLVVLGNTSGTNTGDQNLSGYFNKSTDDTDDITAGATNKFATAAEKTKLGHITVTQAVDLDQIESDTTTNNSKVSNATHTGEVTGATALTVDKTAITSKTTVTALGADYLLISDTSDSGNLKKALVSDLMGSGSVAWGSVTGTLSDQTDLQTALDAKQSLDSDLTAIAGISPSNDDIIQRKSGAWTNRTPAQFKTDLSLTKSDVGLSNVDNTSDASKPVSTATQTALDAKQPLDADLTTIAGLIATTDNFMQSKAGAWASRTIAQVKTDLGLSGTNTGDQTSIVGITGTKAQFDTAVTDGNFLFVGDITQYTAELAQDAVGAMLDANSLEYTHATPLLAVKRQMSITADSLGLKLSGDASTPGNSKYYGTNVSGTKGYFDLPATSVADADYGDITVSGSGTVWTVDNDAITYAKIQNVSATDKLLGRISSGAGDIEEITFTDFAQSLLDDTSATAARTTLGAQAKIYYTVGTADADYIADLTADDVQFQQAFDAVSSAGGGHVHAKKAAYNLSATVNVPSNVLFTAELGTTFTLGAYDQGFVIDTKSNVEFRNIKTDGSLNTEFVVYVKNSTDIKFENCDFLECHSFGLFIQALGASTVTERVWVKNCRLDGHGRNDVIGGGPDQGTGDVRDIIIEGCDVDQDVSLGAGGGTYDTCIDLVKAKRFKFIHNKTKGNIYFGNENWPHRESIIADNTLAPAIGGSACRMLISVNNSTWGTPAGNSYALLVHDNTLENGYIEIEGLSDAPFTRVNIHDNDAQSIVCSFVSYSLISGNSFSGTSNSGILLVNSNHNTVSLNTIANKTDAISESSSDNNTYIGNKIASTNTNSYVGLGANSVIWRPLTDGDKGDITVSSSGATWTVDNGLAATKIADGSVSNAEFQYLGNVTSDIQTQINNKFTLPSLTAGSVLFSNGTTITQDNSNLFWDNTNDRLGVGTLTPGIGGNNTWGKLVHIKGSSGHTGLLADGADSTKGAFFEQVNNNLKSLIFGTYGTAPNVGMDWFGVSRANNSFIITYADSSVGALSIGTTGASALTLGTNNLARWVISSSGHLLAGTDNSYDIGASGATRPRNVFVGTSIRFPDLGYLGDANNNELLILDTVASAVNELTLANAATGGRPNLTATGGDTNIGIQLTPKGAHGVLISGGTLNVGAGMRTAAGADLVAGSSVSMYYDTSANEGHIEAGTWGTTTRNMVVNRAGGSLGVGVSPTTVLDLNGDKIRLRTAKTPASAAASGNQGDIAWDSGFLYVCTATNTWKRAAIATW